MTSDAHSGGAPWRRYRPNLVRIVELHTCIAFGSTLPAGVETVLAAGTARAAGPKGRSIGRGITPSRAESVRFWMIGIAPDPQFPLKGRWNVRARVVTNNTRDPRRSQPALQRCEFGAVFRCEYFFHVSLGAHCLLFLQCLPRLSKALSNASLGVETAPLPLAWLPCQTTNALQTNGFIHRYCPSAEANSPILQKMGCDTF